MAAYHICITVCDLKVYRVEIGSESSQEKDMYNTKYTFIHNIGVGYSSTS